MCLFREYAFEYSYDGINRYKGLLQFNGGHFLQVISDDQKISPIEIQKHDSTVKEKTYINNIIDLNDYKIHQYKSTNNQDKDHCD